jgi:hypothetical protein
MTICWSARLTRWAPSCSARGEQSPLTRNDLICCRALGLLCGLFCGFRLHPFQNILHALQTSVAQKAGSKISYKKASSSSYAPRYS